MKATSKKIVLKKMDDKIVKPVINKKLDKIKTVTFTSDKQEEIKKYNIVVNL